MPLGLATPVAIMVGNGVGAKEWNFVQDGGFSGREQAKWILLLLDKTGTITSGEPKVTDILPADGSQ